MIKTVVRMALSALDSLCQVAGITRVLRTVGSVDIVLRKVVCAKSRCAASVVSRR